MDDKNMKFEDELGDLEGFNEKYNHYAQDNEKETDVNIPDRDTQSTSFYEDISSYSLNSERSDDDIFVPVTEADIDEEPENEDYDDGNFFTRNNKRNSKIIAIVLVIVLLLGFVAFALWHWLWAGSENGIFGEIGKEFNDPDKLTEETIYDDESHKAMGDIQSSDSLNQWLKAWALNGGEKLASKNVINVLLCGVDSTDGTASNARSDSMMIISINRKKKEISMISLLRDSWTYMSLPRRDGTHYDYYFKMNAAYSLGGPATLVETIENNFKIEIDQYIAVDFASFKNLINALGGVTVEVTQKESNYIRRTSSHKQFPVGKAKLNGDQALIYSRIRHLDDDMMRTGRQRKIIKAMIDSAKTATKGQLLNAFKQVSGYLRTGYTQSEIMSLIAQAYTYKWMEYDMTEAMVPNTDYKDRISTYIGDQWAWVVDFVLCAKTVQEIIYGESNIIISDNRVSALDFVFKKNNNSSSGGSGSGSSGNYTNTTSRHYTYVDNDNGNDDNNDPQVDPDVTDRDDGGQDATEAPDYGDNNSDDSPEDE